MARKLLFAFLFCSPGIALAAPSDTSLFRDIFASIVQPGSTDQINHLIYLPTPGLLNEDQYSGGGCPIEAGKDPAETAARTELCKMDSAFKNVDVKSLFLAGAEATPSIKSRPIDLTNNLKSRDLLIVVVPGIFGEFIQKRAFEEIFAADSAFQREWAVAVARKLNGIDCSAVPAGNPACDEQDKLQRLTLDPNNQGGARIPMSDLMNVGSIDDRDGQPLVRLVLFQMDGMTLESLGLQKNNAAIFTRRLEKFFQIMGHTPKDIAFVGYSRGTDYALEMLADAKAQSKPWLSNVRALVSLGGVAFGSALADEGVDDGSSKLARQLHLVQLVSKSLTPLPDLSKPLWGGVNAKWLGMNMLAWYKFLTAIANVQNEDQPKIESSQQSGTEQTIAYVMDLLQKQGGADPAFGIRLAVTEMLKFGLISEEKAEEQITQLTAALQAVSTGNFIPLIKFFQNQVPAQTGANPNPYTVKYNTDIRRFKKLITAAVEGVTELTTDSRLQWWRTHAIPVNIRYYSVSATMADPNTDLGNNRWGYNPGSPDDLGLIQNWLDFQKVFISPEYAGIALNDSQMAVYKTIFWPKMIASLNPANAGVRSTPLAIVGTHHWGLALPIVEQVRKSADQDNGVMQANPFPRTALMQSIATAIANDLTIDEGQK